MIRLMPYSVYEFAAMDRYFSQMQQKNWQYHWRFLCFIRFRKTTDAEMLKCAPCRAEKSNSWIRLYKDDKIADDVRLVHKNEDTSACEQSDVFYAPLKGATFVRFIINALLLLAACVFTVFACASANWASMNALWAMREVSSLIILPFILFLAINQLFLTVRLVKICRFTRTGNSYLPWNNIMRYVFSFLAIVLLLAQLIAGANAKAEAKESYLYNECRSALSDCFESIPTDSLTANRYVLDPLSWEALYHVGEGTVRITYHDCLSNTGAENYYTQFQKDNTGTEQLASSDGNAQKLTAISDDYYSIACVRLDKIFVVTFRELSANEADLLANEIIEIFLSKENEVPYPTTLVITGLSELPPEIGNLTVSPSPEGFSLPEEEYQP